MALSREDKADVKGAMGKAIANKVSKVTKDKPNPNIGQLSNDPGIRAMKRGVSFAATKAHRESGPFKSAMDAIKSPTFSKAHAAIRASKKSNALKKRMDADRDRDD